MKDLNGDLVDWWQSETKARYLEKAKCIIDQYGNYTEPMTGLKVRIIVFINILTKLLLFLFFFYLNIKS